MDKKQLAREFDDLSLEGVACDQAYAKAEHNVYDVVAKAYLYYRKVEGVPKFLDELYAKHGVQSYDKGNTVNFRPFVRVVFRLDLPNLSEAEQQRQRLTPGSQRNRVGNYADAIAAIHAEWCENPDAYLTNPQGKLAEFIAGKGLRRLVDEGKDKRDQFKGKDPVEDDVDVTATRKFLAEHALKRIASEKGKIGSATITKPESVHFNADRLTACICRYNEKTGAYEIIATSSDENAIRDIAEGDTARLDQIASPALRTIAEVVATQSFPARFIPGGNRAKLTGALKAWYNAVYLEQAKVKGTANNRRLVLRGRDILLSARRMDASVVTILKPKYKLVGKVTDEQYLRPTSLRTIEEWIENKTIAARTTTPSNKLGPAAANTAANAMLTVHNKATASKDHRLFFYDVYRKEDNPDSTGQADYTGGTFKRAWSFSAKRAWLMSLRNKFLDEWFRCAASGKKLKRWENNFFDIKITATKIIFGYEIDDTETFPTDIIELDNGAKLAAKASFNFRVSSKDLAPILYNVSDLSVAGSIKFEGDEHVMVISFSTEMGQYTIAIPTVTGETKQLDRDATHFSLYAARGAGVGQD